MQERCMVDMLARDSKEAALSVVDVELEEAAGSDVITIEVNKTCDINKPSDVPESIYILCLRSVMMLISEVTHSDVKVSTIKVPCAGTVDYVGDADDNLAAGDGSDDSLTDPSSVTLTRHWHCLYTPVPQPMGSLAGES